MNPTVIALIAARGGSKGVPRKNLALVGGRPLLAWPIRAALDSGVVSAVIVSTEDEEIDAEARKWGAEVPFRRPTELARDDSAHMDVVLHALDQLEVSGRPVPDFVLILQATSPFVSPEDIRQAVELARTRAADSVVSVCASKHHPSITVRLDPDGGIRPYDPANGSLETRRQDFAAAYALNGAVTLTRRQVLLTQRTFYPPSTFALVMPPDRSIDIDDPYDLELARRLAPGRDCAPPKRLRIGARLIGCQEPCFVIAEAGVNHNGDLDLAMRLVAAAAHAGADAVKFQTFSTDRTVTPSAPKASYQLLSTDREESQAEMLRALELSEDAHRRLAAEARRRGVIFLSTPFDEESADFLESLDVPAFKISSGEITNLPFLAHVAKKGRPMIVSTGMADLDEVAAAVRTIRAAGNVDLVLLQCVSEYPARPEDANLRAMATMQNAFDAPVGYSDHTAGLQAAFTAVALGACVVEKHLTLDKGLPGPDHAASIEPADFAALVRGIRSVESSLGNGLKRPVPSEAETAAVSRKSIVAARNIPAGSIVSRGLLALKCPGTGMSPVELDRVVGRTAIEDIPMNTLIRIDMLR